MSETDQKRRVVCPGCQAGLRVLVGKPHKTIKCPRCEHRFVVPAEKAALQSQSTSSIKKTATGRVEKRTVIPVVCVTCQTRMYADIDQVGQFIECPDCFTPNPIKTPRDAKQITTIAMDGNEFSYGMSDDVAPRPTFAHHAGEIMQEAERKIETEQKNVVPPPRYPFVTGVFTFPFRSWVMPVMIGMAFGLFMALGAFRLANVMADEGSLVAPFAYIVAGVVLAFAVAPMTVGWLRVLEGTVQNEERPDARPEGGLFAFLDWIGEGVYVWSAICYSALPVGLLHAILRFPLDVFAWRLGIVLCGTLCLPIVLLSMLEANSPTMPLTRPILRSLREFSGAWLRFYLLATPVLAATASVALFGATLVVREWTPQVITLAVLCVCSMVIGSTIYFRLLGRMGWLLTQHLFIEDEEDSESPEVFSTDKVTV